MEQTIKTKLNGEILRYTMEMGTQYDYMIRLIEMYHKGNSKTYMYCIGCVDRQEIANQENSCRLCRTYSQQLKSTNVQMNIDII